LIEALFWWLFYLEVLLGSVLLMAGLLAVMGKLNDDRS